METQNNKIIIVKIKDTESDIISRIKESLEEHYKRYYCINEDDSETAERNADLKCIIAFIVFKELEDKKYQNTDIYIGDGHIVNNDKGWRIYYNIKKHFNSDMIINNFISNSELDLKDDFATYSYMTIENNKELVSQMSMLSNPVYVVDTKPISEQIYHPIEKENTLHEYSQFNQNCKRPIGRMDSQENRSEFQRDYERIIHSKAFRRLVDKAQIFTSSKGDHYRTRMTHTLEVAQIARAIAVGLNLNVELTEAIALAHDLGHTPFGHQGERTLDNILKNEIKIIKHTPEDNNFYGGFKHNFQGIRVADYLEDKYIDFEGIDLSYQVLEGILKHTSVRIKDCENCPNGSKCNKKCFDIKEFLPNGSVDLLYPQYIEATTLEGQIVKIADEIAQRSHDLDDSFAAGILNIEQLSNYLSIQKMEKLRTPLQEIQEHIEVAKAQNRVFINEKELHHSNIVSAVIHFFITDVIENSITLMCEFEKDDFYEKEHRFSKKLIDFSNDGQTLCSYLEKIISKKVINSPEVVRFDSKAERIIVGLFTAYYNNPKLLHQGTLRKIYIEMRKDTDNVIDFINGDLDEVRKEINLIINEDLSKMDESIQKEYEQKKKILVRAIVDYISGMTDSYAINEYNSIYK